MTHPTVQSYRDNKERYDANYFLSFFDRMARRNPHLVTLCSTVEYKAFFALCTNAKPFDDIIAALNDLSIEDLDWLIENLPSGWTRAQVMDKRYSVDVERSV